MAIYWWNRIKCIVCILWPPPNASSSTCGITAVKNHKCEEICQSNVFISSNIPVLQSYKNKCHTWNVICMIGKLQNQQFSLLDTDTPVCQQDLILLVRNVSGVQRKLTMSTQIQHKGNCVQIQQTGKCCVVPSVQQLWRLAAQWKGLKQWELTERWRITQMDSDTSLTWLAVILMPSLQQLF